MKTKHTPGPWGFNVGKNGKVNGFEAVRIYGKEDMVLDFAHCNPGQNEIDAARVVACVNACEGIEDPSVVPDLLSGLKDLFQMIDENILVRNTDNDHKPEWAGLMIGTVTRLKFAYDAIARAEGRTK